MNYLKSECYRTLRCRGLLISAGVIFALCGAVVLLCAWLNRDSQLQVSGTMILGLVIAISGSFLYLSVMVGAFIDNGEKKDHTVKHTVAYGVSREKLYLLRFANQAAWGTAFYILTAALLYLLCALLLPGPDAESTGMYWKTLICLYPLCISALSLYYAISMKMESTNLAMIPLILILSVLPGVLRIAGLRFEILAEAARWFPVSLADYNRILEEPGMMAKCWGIGTLWTVGSCAAGIGLYRRLEIR